MRPAREIQIETALPDYDYDESKIRQLMHWIFDDEGEDRDWSITIVFVDDEYIINLNKQYFSRDTTTDVISFILEDRDDRGEGEIYVCVDQVKRQAVDFDVSFENELCRVVAHGLYHLLGYTDMTAEAKRKMENRQERALKANYF